jgi:hypothetical protein
MPAFLAVLLLAFAPLAGAQMPRVDAQYTLSRGVLTLGKARFSLQETEDGCYHYAYTATPTGLARMFIGEIREVSEFCEVDGVLQPRRYAFSRADRPEGDYRLDFDLEHGQATTDDGRVQTFDGDVIDRLALQLKVQRWVMAQGGEPGEAEYSVTQVEDDRVRTYRFRIMARETLRLDRREIETVRVERVDTEKRSIRIWAAPADDYQIVQVEHIEDGKVQFRMQRD